ncbi:hypothetical protein [Nostoc sp.]
MKEEEELGILQTRLIASLLLTLVQTRLIASLLLTFLIPLQRRV